MIAIVKKFRESLVQPNFPNTHKFTGLRTMPCYKLRSRFSYSYIISRKKFWSYCSKKEQAICGNAVDLLYVLRVKLNELKLSPDH